MKKLILPALLVIFGGCVDKNFAHDLQKNEILAYTKKFEFIKPDRRYVALASYINPVLILDENDTHEYILLSYFPDDAPRENSVKINGVSAKFEPLNDGSKMLKFSDFSMKWGAHAQIIAPQIMADTLNLSYETNSGIRVNFVINKISKSMYWNPKIKLKD